MGNTIFNIEIISFFCIVSVSEAKIGNEGKNDYVTFTTHSKISVNSIL